MNCGNCGAPTKVASSGNYLFCEYCGSLTFPEERDDRVQVLGEISRQTCPVCEETLLSAKVARFASALYCENCRGMLVQQEIFGKLVEHLRSSAIGPVEAPRPLNQADLQRFLSCPNCDKKFDTHPYYGPGNFVIDICTDCGLVWLDHGEIDAIITAPGRDRRQNQTKKWRDITRIEKKNRKGWPFI